VIPAWTLLERESIAALLTPEPRMPRAIHIKTTAEPAELAAAPILCATRAFIERAQASGGLTLTLGGALSRADTKALLDITEWPDYDRASVLAVNKVLNEDDVLPIQFTRMVAQDARLLRAAKGRLLPTRRATTLLDPSGMSDLFRTMFETAFWRINLQPAKVFSKSASSFFSEFTRVEMADKVSGPQRKPAAIILWA